MFKVIIQDESIDIFVHAVVRIYFLDIPIEDVFTKLDICEEIFAKITRDPYKTFNSGEIEPEVIKAYKGIQIFIGQKLKEKFGLSPNETSDLEFSRFSFIDTNHNVFLEMF